MQGFKCSLHFDRFEHPEKLGNALAHIVSKLSQTFLDHPGGTAGPASRPPRAAQGGVMIFFSRPGLKNPNVRIFHARPWKKNHNTALCGPGRPAGWAGRPTRMAKKCPEKLKNLVRQSVSELFWVPKPSRNAKTL